MQKVCADLVYLFIHKIVSIGMLYQKYITVVSFRHQRESEWFKGLKMVISKFHDLNLFLCYIT